ncbi:MAG TPA: lipoprotein-releasing ABC transporter permease subunit [Oceanicaulis sp.]|nr:lipoprotein-releasing ABC transporter permease subunit [Oceanicaulis sp.]
MSSDAAATEAAPQSGAAPFSRYEFLLAFKYLRARRKHGGVTLISVISFVGIMLAVAVLITVMSVMNGFRHELLTRLLGVQPHVYVMVPADQGELSRTLADRIRALDGVRQAGPVATGQALVTSGRSAAFASVSGVRPEDLARFDLITGAHGADDAGGGLAAGSIDRFGEGRNGGDVIIMGTVMANQLGVGVGDQVTLVSPQGATTALGMTPRSKRYTIGGLLSVGVQDLDQVLIYMPLDQASLFFNKPAQGEYIDVRIANPDAPEPVMEQIRAMAPQGAVIFDWRRQNQAFWNALQVERVAMRLILSAIVLIAAMNIISGLVMLVKNKTKDIAILRTMGASQGAVMRIFLIAGAAVGVLGTLAGIALGLLAVIGIGPLQDFVSWVSGVNVFDPSVYSLYRLPARLDWGEVAFVSFWGFFPSLIATLAPSWRAGRIDPVEALRYE